jgi:hypothetical protein
MQATRFRRHLNVTTEQLARPGGCCIRKLRGSAARRTRVANFSVTDVPVTAACEPNDAAARCPLPAVRYALFAN